MKTITISGSMLFYKNMKKLKTDLEKLGFSVNIPELTVNIDSAKYNKYSSKEQSTLKFESSLIKRHYDKLMNSDAILIANYDKNGSPNYIGGNTLMEMGFAYIRNKPIFMIKPIPDLSYKAEIKAMQPIIIGEQLAKIQEFFEKLPKVFISSTSNIKIQAVSFAFQELGHNYNVIGTKAKSGVREQPMDIEETYKGAVNRLADLKKRVKDESYEYLISIESGLARLHKNHGYFDVDVCIIEDKHETSKVSIMSNIEILKEMTDLIPNQYPDLGILVQEKYNSRNKDPFPYLTNGKIKRRDILQYVVKNTLAQFKYD